MTKDECPEKCLFTWENLLKTSLSKNRLLWNSKVILSYSLEIALISGGGFLIRKGYFLAITLWYIKPHKWRRTPQPFKGDLLAMVSADENERIFIFNWKGGILQPCSAIAIRTIQLYQFPADCSQQTVIEGIYPEVWHRTAYHFVWFEIMLICDKDW